MAARKKCERCGVTKGVTIVDEIIDRFQVEEVPACPRCAKKIERENRGLQN